MLRWKLDELLRDAVLSKNHEEHDIETLFIDSLWGISSSRSKPRSQ